jgi:hypothetical protein
MAMLKVNGLWSTLIVSLLAFGMPKVGQADNVPVFTQMRNDELLGDAFCTSVRTVISRLVKAAEGTDLQGDARTEAIIREALSGLELPENHRRRAIVLGLAVAFDQSQHLRKSVLTQRFWLKYESDAENRARLKVWGNPTMYERADLPQHFFIAGGLVALTTPETAEATSILKEVTDANGGSGFSYVDMGSNLAGIIYATEMIRQREVPSVFVEGFEIKSLVPDFSDLAEGVMLTELRADFSLDSESRFRRVIESIRSRVVTLPVYRALRDPAEKNESVSVK